MVSIMVAHPVNIINNTGTAISNYQQMVVAPICNNCANASVSNVMWAYDPAGASIIPSWLEGILGSTIAPSNTVNGSLVYWLKIAGTISAGATQTVYMIFADRGTTGWDGTLTGVAPQWTATYGQYDNGASVFNFYDNFAGTSLNTSKWNANPYGYYSVNNGLTIKPAQATTSASPGEVTSTTNFGANTIFEFYGTPVFSGGTGWGYGTYGYNPGDAGAIILRGDIVGDANSGTANTMIWAGSIASATFTQTEGIYTIIQTSSQVTGMFNYGSSVSTKSNIGSSSYPVGFYVGNGMSGNAFIQWTRIRAYPPNGVMPAIQF